MFTRLAALTIHRSRAVLIVSGAVLVLLAILAAGAFSELKSGGFNDPSSDSSRAAAVINQDFGGQTNLVLLVTPAQQGASLDTPAVKSAATRIVTKLGAMAQVSSVRSYWTGGSAMLQGADQRSGLIAMHVSGSDADSADTAQRIADAYAVKSGAIDVRAAGKLGVTLDINSGVGTSLAIAEAIAVPITLLLLLFAFGSLLTALLPLAIGVFAVAGTFAELAVLGRLTDVSIYAINLTTALGLGLAIDYSLLIVNRFREELRHGADVHSAVRRTVLTAGRTVVFSSATVAVALSSLLLFPVYFLRSFAYAGIGVVLIAMTASLLTLPALLSVLGARVGRGRVQSRRTSEESVAWRRIATVVMRRPLVVAAPVIAALLFLATPLLHIAFGTPNDRVLPTSVGSRQVGDVLRSQYAGGADANITAVIQGSVSTKALSAYTHHLTTISGVVAVSPPITRSDATYLTITGPRDSSSQTSQNLVATIRAVAAPGSAHVLVGGSAAELVDSKTAIGAQLPWAILWICLTTFILLFLSTGSVILPLKALLLNVLSLGSVFGVLVWIFQDGHLAGLLGFTPQPLNTAMLVLMFCIAFGLSMDYEVFLISRIREAHDEGLNTTDAVAIGLARTGRIVTTAALLLCITFFAFGTASVSFIQLFGIGTGIAIVLDATVIRGLLVPAFMRVAGEINWWAPPPLTRLYRRIGLHEDATAADHSPENSLTG